MTPTPEIEREYPYRPRWIYILAGAAFFGAGAVFMGFKAVGNDRGLIINGLIELSVTGATIFYWAVSGLNGSFVVAAGLITVHRLTFNQRIAFTADGIILPRSRWSSAEIHIAYREVSALVESEVNGQKFLRVMHDGGKQTIIASMLHSKAAFEEVRSLLEARVEFAKQRQGPG